MAKGSVAKVNVANKIAEAFGADYVGCEDGKKWYVWADDGGERVQIAITMTCPKTNFAGSASAPAAINDAVATISADVGKQPSVSPTKMVSEDEQAILDRLRKELDL